MKAGPTAAFVLPHGFAADGAGVAAYVRKQARALPVRAADHRRFASGAAAPRIVASRRLRSEAAALNLAADCCFDDAPPPADRLIEKPGYRRACSRRRSRAARAVPLARVTPMGMHVCGTAAAASGWERVEEP